MSASAVNHYIKKKLPGGYTKLVLIAMAYECEEGSAEANIHYQTIAEHSDMYVENLYHYLDDLVDEGEITVSPNNTYREDAPRIVYVLNSYAKELQS